MFEVSNYLERKFYKAANPSVVYFTNAKSLSYSTPFHLVSNSNIKPPLGTDVFIAFWWKYTSMLVETLSPQEEEEYKFTFDQWSSYKINSTALVRYISKQLPWGNLCKQSTQKTQDMPPIADSKGSCLCDIITTQVKLPSYRPAACLF